MSPNTHEIYDLARYCNDSFKDLVQQDDDQTLEEYQQRFWAWANGLAVFAKPYLSLDARLSNEKYGEIRDIVLLLLGILKKNLDFGLKKTAAALLAELEPSPHAYAASSETSRAIDSSELKPSLRRVKTDLRVPIYGIDGAISRLEKLARAIASASQDSISRRVLAFAENERDEEYEELVKVVVQHLYPPGRVPSTLGNILVNSMLFRYYRILYQRKRHEKEKSTGEKSLVPGRDHTANQSNTGSSNPVVPTLGAVTQPLASDERKSEPDTDTKTALHSIDLDAYKYNMDGKSERVSDQASSAPQTGKILYPRAPDVSDEHGTFKCPICYALLPKLKAEKRNWRNHVNEDLEPYVCISENCAENLRFFPSERLWLQHMRQAHTTTWIRHLHTSDAVSWVCPMHHANTYTGQTMFGSHGDLYGHMTQVHQDSLKDSEIVAMVKRSETRKPRSMDICPLCGDRHSPTRDAIDNDTPHNLDDQEQAIRDSANHARIAPFVGRHLKSLAFFALRKLLDEPDEDDEGKYSDKSDKKVAIDSANSRVREDPDDEATELSTLSFDDEPKVPFEASETSMAEAGSVRPDSGTLEQQIPPTPTSEIEDMYDLMAQQPYDAEDDQKLKSLFSRAAETATSPGPSPVLSSLHSPSDLSVNSFLLSTHGAEGELDETQDFPAINFDLVEQGSEANDFRESRPITRFTTYPSDITVRGNPRDIIHGRLNDNGNLCSLIVYEFHVSPRRNEHRVVSLRIDCRFSLNDPSHSDPGGPGIGVLAIAPHGDMELRKKFQIDNTSSSVSEGTTRPDDIDEHIVFLERQRAWDDEEVLRIPGPRDVERGMVPEPIGLRDLNDDSRVRSGKDTDAADSARPPGTAAEVRPRIIKTKEPQRGRGARIWTLRRRTPRDVVDAVSISGFIFISEGQDYASWKLVDDQIDRSGIPKVFRTAVLLTRKTDGIFASQLRFSAYVNVNHNLNMHTKFVSTNDDDQTLVYNPLIPTNVLGKYNANNLGAVDLTELVGGPVTYEEEGVEGKY